MSGDTLKVFGELSATVSKQLQMIDDRDRKIAELETELKRYREVQSPPTEEEDVSLDLSVSRKRNNS